jgi:4-amino-4-deoxy-L-arabinose transferase-like glycosyltransferase
MSKPNRWHAPLQRLHSLFRLRSLFRRRAKATALTLLLVAFGFAFYAWDAPTNPPGFFIDESSVAYNAYLIGETGRDEHDEAWPLYFRAFGDYKNPVYVYLLAALFRVTGPSIAAARYFNAALGVLTALALGLLGARVTGRRAVGWLTCLTALLTPWLFELSRVVVEVAVYPLAVALLLLCARRASEKGTWRLTDATCVAAALALVTYAYSVGRLFGPLLALGLLLLATTRARLRAVLTTWALYALALVPMLVYHLRHPDALTKRFSYLTYLTPESSYAEDVWEFAKHYAGNLNPWRMLVTGDVNASQIASIPGAGVLAAATFLTAALGAWLALKEARRDGWRRFLLFGLAASVVPASLTKEYFHMLRLAALPVFVVALAAPGFAWLLEGGRVRRAALAAVVVLTLAQGALFRRRFEASASAPWRLHLFDADYPAKILPAALAASPREVHLADSPSVPGYIQGLWYAATLGVPRGTVIVLPADAPTPAASVVITTEDVRPRCRTLAASEPYTVCATEGPPRAPAPLSAGAFRAEFRALDVPERVAAQGQAKIRVAVRNAGDAVWLARERGVSPFQLSAGNHWLDASGRTVTHDDGRGALPRNLPPGEEVEITFNVNAPRRPGDYLLEIDMLQEAVSWFTLKGSKTLRVPVKVE